MQALPPILQATYAFIFIRIAYLPPRPPLLLGAEYEGAAEGLREGALLKLGLELRGAGLLGW
jgi:hypothetical protein